MEARSTGWGIAIIREKDANGSNQGHRSVHGKKWSWDIETLEPTGFAGGLDVGERGESRMSPRFLVGGTELGY